MQVVHQTFMAMHTRFSLVIPGSSADAALLRAIEAHVVAQEHQMSRFSDGPLAELNAAAFGKAVPVPAALWKILIICRTHWQKTNGLFDIALGRFRDVMFQEKNQSLRFTSADVRLDLGAIGKGLALSGVGKLLRRAGIASALVSFGESSVLALGKHPFGSAWPIALAEAPETVLALRDESLSVSGQGERRHIIDPRSGDWAAGPKLTAVTAPCPSDAEVLSTALFIAAEDEREEILARYPAARLTIIQDDFLPAGSLMGPSLHV